MSLQILRTSVYPFDSNTILKEGECCAEISQDLLSGMSIYNLKIGNGVNTYNDLPYVGDNRFVKINDNGTQIISGTIEVSQQVNTGALYVEHIRPFVSAVSTTSEINVNGTSIEMSALDGIQISNTADSGNSFDLLDLLVETYSDTITPWTDMSSSNKITISCYKSGRFCQVTFSGLLTLTSKIAGTVPGITLPTIYTPITNTFVYEAGLNSNAIGDQRVWWIDTSGKIKLVNQKIGMTEVNVSFCYMTAN